MSVEEKEVAVPQGERYMDAFRNTMDDCGMRDLGYRGSCFILRIGVRDFYSGKTR